MLDGEDGIINVETTTDAIEDVRKRGFSLGSFMTNSNIPLDTFVTNTVSSTGDTTDIESGNTHDRGIDSSIPTNLVDLMTDAEALYSSTSIKSFMFSSLSFVCNLITFIGAITIAGSLIIPENPRHYVVVGLAMLILVARSVLKILHPKRRAYAHELRKTQLTTLLSDARSAEAGQFIHMLGRLSHLKTANVQRTLRLAPS